MTVKSHAQWAEMQKKNVIEIHASLEVGIKVKREFRSLLFCISVHCNTVRLQESLFRITSYYMTENSYSDETRVDT